MDTLRSSDEPVALLTADDAQTWRAVALAGSANGRGEVAVAIADPTDEVVAKLEARLGRPVHARLCDEETLDELLNRVYADARRGRRHAGAARGRRPSCRPSAPGSPLAQALAACALGFLLVVGVLTDLLLTATVLVAFATAFFVASTGFRLWAAWQGFRPGATIDPRPASSRPWTSGRSRSTRCCSRSTRRRRGPSARCSTRCRGWTIRSTSWTRCC